MISYKIHYSSLNIFKTIIILIITLFITLTVGLYSTINSKSEKMITTPKYYKNYYNKLPPKPKERWHYIKELENKTVIAELPTEPFANGKNKSLKRLTNEKRELFKQIQTNIRQESTSLYVLPNNKHQTFNISQIHIIAPESNIVMRQPLIQVPHQILETKNKILYQKPVLVPLQSIHNSSELHTIQVTPRKTVQHWLVQCGPFHEINQAELIRVQLAFAGIESSISINNKWHYVLIGPYSNRFSSDKILQNLRATGISNCISVTTNSLKSIN